MPLAASRIPRSAKTQAASFDESRLGFEESRMPPELKTDTEQPEMWQSVESWMGSPQFDKMMKDEFPEDAGEWLDPVSRRQFLTLAGASVALAGAIGCNPSVRPASPRKVVPYVRQPEQIIPGIPLFFATAMAQAGGVGLGLLVKSNEGRPTKVEGNPNHPSSLGGANSFALASTLGLYDPDRSKNASQAADSTTNEAVANALLDTFKKLKDKKGAGVRVLAEPCTSPTLNGLAARFLASLPSAKWISYEPLAADNAVKASVAAFNKPLTPVYHLDKAKAVLAIDSDFLAALCPASVRNAKDFMAKRKFRDLESGLKAGDGVKPEDMNRLYSVESMFTCTGATADHRLPLTPTQIESFTRALATKFGIAAGTAGALPEFAQKCIDPIFEDLNSKKGSAAVIVGETQPPAVHQLALAINEKLDAFKANVVTFIEPLNPRAGDSIGELKALVEDMKAGKVEALIVLGTNPVYDAPVDLDFARALESVKYKLHYGLYKDETAANCTWHVPAAHYLESWGDLKGHDGTIALQQPLIAPLHGGISPLSFVSTLVKAAQDVAGVPEGQKTVETSDPLELVKAEARAYFTKAADSGDFENWWQHAVRDGVIPGSASKPVAAPAVNVAAIPTPAKADGIEVQFRADPTLYDGRFANNGWLQELPKPITKITWDNAAIVSPSTAVKLGCESGFGWTGGENGRTIADVVELTLEGRKLKIAVWILPGHADDVVTLYVGHGRTERAGKTADSKGFNTYKLRSTTALWNASGLTATKTGETYFLACTQGQHAMESRRPLRHGTVVQFAKDEEFAQIPPVSAEEYKEIRANTPGTEEDWVRLHGKDGKKFPHSHTHAHGPTETAKKDEPKHEEHKHDPRVIPLSLYPDNPQKVHGEDASKTYRRWGMAFDLSACTGCSACIMACVSENNIPVVGKEQVTKGRAMHWIRVDRYFSIPTSRTMEDTLGGKDVKDKVRAEKVKESANIRAHVMPVPCQQCEKAPCEVVCPVAATVHSADGLNDMVYNRCVGTRYCSNNCPYKVRRFNFLQFADYSTASMKLLNNPEVTVRQRGVMEKCTYCVQRIRNAEIEAEREWKLRPKDASDRPKIKDGEIVTACQAACPTGAIAFGDLNDPDSQVLRWKAEPTNYGLLAELNTMPRTSYLAAIRNPNPKMPQGA